MSDDDNRGLGKGLTVGFEMAIGAGLGAFVGNWWDRHHGTGPWGLLVGLLIGVAAGMYVLIKEVNRSNKD